VVFFVDETMRDNINLQHIIIIICALGRFIFLSCGDGVEILSYADIHYPISMITHYDVINVIYYQAEG